MKVRRKSIKPLRAYAVVDHCGTGRNWILSSEESYPTSINVDGKQILIIQRPPLAIYPNRLSAALRCEKVNDGPEHVVEVEIREIKRKR